MSILICLKRVPMQLSASIDARPAAWPRFTDKQEQADWLLETS
ncbi:hypothetical protein P0D75_17300 [Paraburkholderia sediminicola]